MSNEKDETTAQEPKLAFPKGCFWSMLLSVPVWGILIWLLIKIL